MYESDAMGMLENFINNSPSEPIIVAQYAPFDLSFMYKHGIAPNRFICTRTLSKFVEPEESASLQPTCDRLGIERSDSHRAIADVEATVELFKIRRKQVEDLEYSYMNTVMDSTKRPLRFKPMFTKKVITHNNG